MPPYQNESLDDMHALMQQFDTLNAAHAPEHLEGLFSKKQPENGGTAPAPPANTDGKGMLSRMTGGLFGGKKPAETALSVKDEIWKALSQTEQVTIFNNTFKEITTNLPVGEHPDIKQFLESNAKTKTIFQSNIMVNPQPK